MSTTERPAPRPARTHLALGTLFLGAFVVGSAELIIVGILNLVAKDVGVSISTVGMLATGYALGNFLGGPILAAATMRLGRRFLLRLTLAIYIAGNILAVVAVGFGVFLVARIVTGMVHGLFIGVALAVAASIVTPDRVGRAISTVLSGTAVSTVLGVPLGTVIGQAMGWQAAFVAIVIVGVVALICALVFLPPVHNSGVSGFGAQARAALAPPVLAVLGTGFLIMAGQFAALTYLTPYLEDVVGIPGPYISVFLVAYGVANAIGTFLGGRAADRNASATMVAANAALILALGVFAAAGSMPVLAAVAMGVWGLVSFGFVPSFQYRVVSLAGPGGDFAAILPASIINAGIAAGATIGGWALADQGAAGAVVVGLILCAVALPATWATGWLRPPADGFQQAPRKPVEPMAEKAATLATMCRCEAEKATPAVSTQGS